MYTLKELQSQGVPEPRLELRRLRKQKRLTTARLGKLAGVSEYIVTSYELGARWAEKYGPPIQAALSTASATDYRSAMREWRESHGLSVAEAARLLGVWESTWRLAERRGFKYLPKGDLAPRIDALLASRPDTLLAPECQSVA